MPTPKRDARLLSAEPIGRRRAFCALGAALAALLIGGPAEAQSYRRRRRPLLRELRRRRRERLRERAAARAALDRGEVRPLSELLDRFDAEIGGEVLDVTFREGPRGWRGYIVRSVQPDGRLADHVINARTGEIITMAEALRRRDAARR